MRLLVALLLLLPAVAFGQNAQRLPPGVACGSGAPPAGLSPVYMDAAGNLCSSAGPAIAGTNGTPTDRSGTITLGGTAQALMAANPSRRGCELQNISAGDLWVSEVGTAAAQQPSRWLPAGAVWMCPPNGIPTSAVSIFGATTSQAFEAREW